MPILTTHVLRRDFYDLENAYFVVLRIYLAQRQKLNHVNPRRKKNIKVAKGKGAGEWGVAASI